MAKAPRGGIIRNKRISSNKMNNRRVEQRTQKERRREREREREDKKSQSMLHDDDDPFSSCLDREQ
jgi:ribosomal protein L9